MCCCGRYSPIYQLEMIWYGIFKNLAAKHAHTSCAHVVSKNKQSIPIVYFAYKELQMDVLTVSEMQALIDEHGDNIKIYTDFFGLVPCGSVRINAQDGFTRVDDDLFFRGNKAIDCLRYDAKSGGYILIPKSLVL